MAYLDIDTDALRAAVSVAQQANEEISGACTLLNQVVTHNDWVCAERDQINSNTLRNQELARTIQEHSGSFYQAVSRSSARFDEVEQSNISRVNQVEELLAQIISVVPGITGGTSSPVLASFDGIQNSLGG